jgi:mono/diheme cytochrome c family protein
VQRRPGARSATPGRHVPALLAVALALSAACGEGGRGYGIDPAVARRPLPGADAPVDETLARAGAAVFQDRCVACHKLGPGVAVGPDLSGVTERRTPEWIRGMVLSPDSMLRTDSTARALLAEYQVPMMDPRIGEPEFRALLEFLRSWSAGR